MLLAVFLYLLLPLFPLTPSGFFNKMLEVSEPGALNYFVLFRLILLTLFVSRNLTYTHLSLFGFLDFLLCDQISPTPGLVFPPPISPTKAVVLSFFVRQGLSFSELSTSSLSSLDPTPIMWGSTSFQITSPRSHFLMLMPLLFALLRRIAKPTSFLFPLLPPPEISF